MAVLRMELTQKEVEKIRTCMDDWGIKNQTELVRVLLTKDYQRVIGSPVPNGRKK